MRPTILIICSDGGVAKAVEASLSRRDGNYLLESVASGAEGIWRLNAQTSAPVHAILLSLDTPHRGALEWLDALLKAAPTTPILVLASEKLEGRAKLAVRRGAYDYILENDIAGRSLSKAIRNMIEHASNAEALFSANERAALTLSSIADAVISTDMQGFVTFLNPIAESLTGWATAEAVGRPIDEVLRIVDNIPGRLLSPMMAAIRNNRTEKLPAGCKLMRRDLALLSIEDSAAPIHDRTGQVTGAVMVFHDVTQAQAISQKMSHLAQHDYLTDLPNRVLLDDRLSQAIASARRNDRQLAVLFIDLDRFKHVNDSLGHTVGDKLLVSVASRLVAGVRGSDTVSRQGGNEFVVLLSSIAHAEHASLSAQKLIDAIVKPHLIENHNLQITISIGISVYPEDGRDADTLIKHADIAMSHAKDNGRNNFQFFMPSMDERALERQSIEGDLRYAIERGELALHYQPKFDLVTETLTGAEALVRWQRPLRPIVCPKDFIPIAEQCGYIVPIGRWVLRQACIQNRIWLDAQLDPIPVAVNISAVELRSKHFVGQVRAILQETGAEPTLLEFELTETALMQDPHSTIAVLTQLKDMGIRLTLDDFGTGYSSLSYLRKFPIDALKIDKSFVHGLCVNQNDAKIVSAVIGLGRSFRLQVIAEGVETRAQFLALQGQDCGEGQGYYFQPPVAAREFTKLLGSDLSTTVVAQ